MQALAPVLAHTFSWSELIWVCIPLTAFVAILRVTNRRAEALRREREAQAEAANPANRAGT